MRFSLTVRIVAFVMPFVFFNGAASASLLIEPYVGYMPSGKTEVAASGAETTSEGLSGLVYGARAGWVSMLGLMAGADYSTGALKDSKEPKTDSTPSNLGVFVGYEFPVLIRVWGVYGLKNEVKVKGDSSSTTYKDGSKYMKVGIGYTALPLVSINLEYATTQFDLPEPLDGTIKSNGIVVGVSLPLEL